MKKEVIEKVLSEFPFAKYRDISLAGLPVGGWFLIEASPLPPLNELALVVADINRGDTVSVPPDLIIRHSSSCRAENHKIPQILENIINKLSKQVFRFAIWEGSPTILNGQPVVIPLQPEVSYHVYPDHPHLNIGCLYKTFYLPDSICYTHDSNNLGDDPYERISEAIFEVSLWLLRHQVWLSTREIGKAKWIGPEIKNPDHVKNVSLALNPIGHCHCGSNKTYFDCHMKYDYKIHHGININDNQISLLSYINKWRDNRENPHNWVINKLNRLFR